MLVTRAGLQTGEWVLVLGNRWRRGDGCLPDRRRRSARRSFCTSSSDEKLARASELGAGRRRQPRVGGRGGAAREATEGRGVDVVVEHVGEATWRTSLDVAAQGGRVVVCGATTGPNPPAALHRIWWKELCVLGSTMGTKDDFEAPTASSKRQCQVIVDAVFPLADARAAHERLEAGEQLGKIVLSIPG